ncbi:MAG: CARDB domain-containing protein, partial [Microcystaceae cyanobacterium]
RIPDSVLGNGYLLVKTDFDNRQPETDETDNVYQAIAIKVTRPNLVVTDFTAPTIAGSGQYITASWTVQNQGDVDTYNGWYDRVVYSVDNVWGNDDDVYLGEYYGSGLAVNGSYTSSPSLRIPDSVLGNGYLLVKTDFDNRQPETDETDNVYQAIAIKVTRPNLVVT